MVLALGNIRELPHRRRKYVEIRKIAWFRKTRLLDSFKNLSKIHFGSLVKARKVSLKCCHNYHLTHASAAAKLSSDSLSRPKSHTCIKFSQPVFFTRFIGKIVKSNLECMEQNGSLPTCALFVIFRTRSENLNFNYNTSKWYTHKTNLTMSIV